MQLWRRGDGAWSGSFAIEPNAYVVVNELGLVVHQRAIYRRIRQRAVRGDVEFYHNGQTILSLVE